MGLLNFLSVSSATITAVAETLSAPKGFWEWLLLKVFGLIGDYGLSIILFIVALKLVLLPIDIFQRVKMRKNQKISERIKPQLEQLQKTYGNDKQMLSQKQMELNKKEGFSYFSSCIPMIVTLFVFITLLQGMNNLSQYMIFKQYAEWYDVYTETLTIEKTQLGEEYENLVAERDKLLTDEGNGEASLNELITRITSKGVTVPDIDTIKSKTIGKVDEIIGPVKNMLNDNLAEDVKEDLNSYIKGVTNYLDTQDKRTKLDEQVTAKEDVARKNAQEAVWKYNDENANSFLWIKSIWRPDTTTSPVFSSKEEFTNATSAYTGERASGCGSCASCLSCKSSIGLDDETVDTMLSKYTEVTARIIEEEQNKKNGYFILVVMVVLLSFFSQWITQRIQKKSGQMEANGATGSGPMKAMMIVMPLMLGIFAVSYTAAFALYMVTNSAITILINVITNLIFYRIDKKQHHKVLNEVNKYGRPDPRDFKK